MCSGYARSLSAENREKSSSKGFQEYTQSGVGGALQSFVDEILAFIVGEN